MNESMIFYNSFLEAIEDLPAEDFKKATLAILKYGLQSEITEDAQSGIVKIIFSLVKPQIDANTARRENGKKGGAPKGNSNAKKQPKQLKQPMVELNCNEKQPNVNVNENVNVNVNENVNENVNVTPPTVGVSARTCEEQEEEAPSKVLPFTVGKAKRDYISFYSQNIGIITPIIIDEAESFIEDDGIEDGCIVLALKEAVSHGANNWAYAKSILTRWLERGITTEKRARSAILEYQRGKTGKKQDNYAPKESEYEKFMRELAEV